MTNIIIYVLIVRTFIVLFYKPFIKFLIVEQETLVFRDLSLVGNFSTEKEVNNGIIPPVGTWLVAFRDLIEPHPFHSFSLIKIMGDASYPILKIRSESLAAKHEFIIGFDDRVNGWRPVCKHLGKYHFVPKGWSFVLQVSERQEPIDNVHVEAVIR